MPSRGERIYILEQSAQGACQLVVDILSRFEFEQALFAGRRERELSIGELNRLMLAAQEATYGDALAKDERHPYMWAVKGHYYSPDLSYYNYPYLFGLLFGLGLYATTGKSQAAFPDRYDALLASTGRASAADLAARFDIDLHDRGFWRSSLARDPGRYRSAGRAHCQLTGEAADEGALGLCSAIRLVEQLGDVADARFAAVAAQRSAHLHQATRVGSDDLGGRGLHGVKRFAVAELVRHLLADDVVDPRCRSKATILSSRPARRPGIACIKLAWLAADALGVHEMAGLLVGHSA